MRKLCKKMKRNQQQLKKLWNQFAEKRLGANSMKNTCNHQLTSFFRGFLLLSFVINGSALSAAVPRVGYTQESNWPNSRPFRLRGWPLLARQFNAVSGFMRNESAMKALWCGKVGGDPALGLGGRHRRCIVVRSSYLANCTSPAKSSLDSVAGLVCRAWSSNPRPSNKASAMAPKLDPLECLYVNASGHPANVFRTFKQRINLLTFSTRCPARTPFASCHTSVIKFLKWRCALKSETISNELWPPQARMGLWVLVVGVPTRAISAGTNLNFHNADFAENVLVLL